MATYVVGDLQGCHATLQTLLGAIEFDPARDRVWFTGDLVNRGAGSLEALRWARQHGHATVLGNHDLHLLAVAAGLREQRAGDTLDEILDAPDRDELMDWLSAQPFVRRSPCFEGKGPEGKGPDWLMVHAGLLPAWTRDQATTLARAASHALREDPTAFLEGLFSRKTRRRDPLLSAVRALTTLRCVDQEGDPFGGHKGSPDQRPPGTHPWFAAPQRAWSGQCRVLCGHWAALGLRVEDEVVALDSGCVWGRSLSAYRLEDGLVVSVPAEGEDLPG